MAEPALNMDRSYYEILLMNITYGQQLMYNKLKVAETF